MTFNFVPVSYGENSFNEQVLEEPVELARDLKTLEFLVKDDKFYYVKRNDALKIWILKALHPKASRSEYRAYSQNYGNEIIGLFGRSLSGALLKSELERCVREALLVNPYIKSVENFNYAIKGSKVELTFQVTTVYGSDFVNNLNYTIE